MQRQLHSHRWVCLLTAPPVCQRPCWNQPTSFHPPRSTSRISPTGIRSRFCSIGSVGGALDFLSLLFPLIVLDPGWSSGISLKGLQAIPNGRSLFQHWSLRSHEQKIFLYDLLAPEWRGFAKKSLTFWLTAASLHCQEKRLVLAPLHGEGQVLL